MRLILAVPGRPHKKRAFVADDPTNSELTAAPVPREIGAMAAAQLEIHHTPRHVLLMIEEWFQDRLATMIRHLVVGMIDSALKLTVVAPPGLEDAFFGPVRVVPFVEPARLLAGRAYRRLIAQLESQPPDAAFLFGVTSRFQRDLRRTFRCPIVRVVSSTEEVHDLTKAGIGATAAVVALSLPLQDAVTQFANVLSSRVQLVRPGVHVATAEEPPRDTEPAETPDAPDARAKPGHEGDARPDAEDSVTPPVTVLVRSPVMTEGGVTTVFRAVRRIVGAGSNVMVFVVGAGELESRLRRECERLGLRDRVIFAMARESERIDPGGFDLFIQSDAEDEIGMTMLHVMGRGVPVLSAGTGNHDCLIDGKTALLYGAGSPDALASQIEKLIDDREFAVSLGAAGREHVRQYHPVSGMANAYVELQASLTTP